MQASNTDDPSGRTRRRCVKAIVASFVVLAIGLSVGLQLRSSTPPGPIAVGLYQFWSKGDSVNSNAVYIIIKGNDMPSTHAKLINYEQAFALNSNEASVARSKGWLAHTCTGKEIHPGNIPGVTLLNGELLAAVDWRSSMIAAETNDLPEAGTYLDTLRPYLNPSFYDGAPCDYTDAGWRTGSVELVNQVRSKTGGRMIIANGAGMGTGRSYFKAQFAVDDFLSRAKPEAVQIEHFARSSKGAPDDGNFMKVLEGKGIVPFAKCQGTTSVCQSTFSSAVQDAASTGRPTRAYLTVLPG
jgi:hypothetical protein